MPAVILSDGSLLVGSYTQAVGAAVSVFHLQLSGTAVVSSREIRLGTNATPAGVPMDGFVSGLTMLPNGLALAAAWGLQPTGPLGASSVALIDPVGATVFPLPGPTQDFNAIAYSPQRGEIYLGTWINSTGSVMSMPISGGAPSVVASGFGGITGLAFDNAGGLVVATNTGTSRLSVLDLNTRTVTPILGTTSVDGLAVDAATGAIFYSTYSDTVFRRVGGSTSTAAAGMWGNSSALAVQSSPRSFGTASARYRWLDAPNPGGPADAGQRLVLVVTRIFGRRTAVRGDVRRQPQGDPGHPRARGPSGSQRTRHRAHARGGARGRTPAGSAQPGAPGRRVPRPGPSRGERAVASRRLPGSRSGS